MDKFLIRKRESEPSSGLDDSSANSNNVNENSLRFVDIVMNTCNMVLDGVEMNINKIQNVLLYIQKYVVRSVDGAE